MKPRVKSGAPQSVLAAGAAESIKDSIEKNSVGQGERPTLPPATKKDVAPDKPKPLAKAKPVQPTLLEVKMDGVGKAAKRMKEALEALEIAQDEKGAASENLQKSLKKSKRTSTSYDGYQFQLKHVGPKDTITIQKPK